MSQASHQRASGIVKQSVRHSTSMRGVAERMRRSFPYAQLGAPAGVLLGSKPPFGMVWGGIAGAVIGTGISLNVELFYSSATGMICAVILGAALMGSVFGQVMAHLLLDVDVSFLGRAAGSEHHRIVENGITRADLTDYRTLRAQGKKLSS